MRVAILGCGYVGLELGRRLVDADAGHDVVGVRRSQTGLDAVAAAGLDPVRADVTDAGSLDAVRDIDWLVVAVSADGRSAEAARETYVRGLETVVEHFSGRADPPDRLVYTGSTGVYGDHGGAWVDEETDPDPGTDRGRVLLDAEAVALDAGAMDGTVARFAGLYGPDRYRVDRYLDGPVTEGYVNLLHRDDAAAAVSHLLEADRGRGEVVLCVDDEPVARPTLAAWLAEQVGVSPPKIRSVETALREGDRSAAAAARLRANKRCSNDRLRGYGYEFTYPTYREGYHDAVAEYRSRTDL